MSDWFDSVFRPGLFEGRAVLVTGGGTGIGRVTAHEFASLGALVAVVGRRRAPVDAVCEEIAERGGRALAIACNVRDEGEVDAAVRAAVAQFGRLDVLVNNAGGQFLAPPEAISRKGWNAVIETNLTGTFSMCQAAHRHWMRRNGGVIVNVLADFWNGMPLMAHTGAARAGVHNLTRSLALAWAPHGVRVNAVAPGIVHSSGLAHYPPEVRPMLRQALGLIPAKRLATPSEVSAAIVFLASPAAAYITGATLRVDGGSSIYRQLAPVADHDRLKPFEGFRLPSDAPEL